MISVNKIDDNTYNIQLNGETNEIIRELIMIADTVVTQRTSNKCQYRKLKRIFIKALEQVPYGCAVDAIEKAESEDKEHEED